MEKLKKFNLILIYPTPFFLIFSHSIADAIVVTRARAAEIFPPQLELEVKPEFDPSEDLPF